MELVLFSVWFWVLIGAWLVGTTYNLHKENLLAASGFLVALFVVFYWTGMFNIVQFVWQNPLLSIQYFAGYLVIGLAWSIFKFKLKLRKIRVAINERVEEFSAHKSAHSGRNHYDYDQLVKAMNVQENKSNLILWALWFPISMIWTLISDFVTDLLEWLLFDVLGKLLQRIVDSEKNKLKV